jgi:DNA-binding transcriptional LysR family regulator
VRAQPSLVLNNGDMMRDAAVAGLGIALLPIFKRNISHSKAC